MPASLLSAIANLVSEPMHELGDFYRNRNRANAMGDALEEYIKDLFAGTINENDPQVRLEKFSEIFSYSGNTNNPPDIILRDGDAIEVKKIESPGAEIALNSSYPKAKLFSDSPMITEACRSCEEWTEKEVMYIIGVVKGKQLKKLYIVYGTDYAASAETYERIKNTIRESVNSLADINSAKTDEIGRVNLVDPLGITYLRVRGMWHIKNPLKVFSYIYSDNKNRDFELMAIINSEKYDSFLESDRRALELLSKNNPDFCITDVKIKTPDNPSKLRLAKLITYGR